MSLFDDASLVLIPDGAKDGKLYSVKPTDGTGDFTFTRGSNLAATRVDENGLIEKGRENLLTYSNTFNVWGFDDVTRTSGQSGYDGSSDAWLIKYNTTASRHNIFRTLSPIYSGIANISIYAKAKELQYIQIASAQTTNQYANFDLSDGSIGNVGSDFFGAKAESIGNGWYRLSVVNTNTSNSIYISLISSKTAGWLESFSGANSTDGLYIQDAQLEVGLVATDYIETTTTTAVSGITEDLPRIDYSGGASCPSLLLEPQRTNLCPHSEYIEGLGLTDLTATPNATTSPEGVQNAYKMLTGTGGSEQIAYQAVGTSGNTKTQSVYIKADSGVQWIRLIQVRAGFANSASTHFDIQNGVKGAKEENGTTSVVDDATKIEDVGNGWYRLTLVCTDSTNNTNFDTRVRTAIADGSGTRVSNGSYFVWGYQMESDASYPTSYIPTYGTSVTRSLDAMNNSSLGLTDCTFFVDFVPLSSIMGLLDFYDNSNALAFYIAIDAVKYLTFNSVQGGTIGQILGPLTIGDRIKLAFTLNASNGDVTIFINGTKYSTYSTTISSLNKISHLASFGYFNNTEFNQIITFPTALTDSECIALTTI